MELVRRSLLGLAALGLATLPAVAQGQGSITVASTTSTEQSGLFSHLLPAFTKKTGIDVKVVAVGTGQALDIGRRGDADVVLVHDRPAEEAFVNEGHGVARVAVMANDFVLVGPGADPARVAGTADAAAAFGAIAGARATFVSRGDRSGTHAAELRTWGEAGIDIAGAKGAWYKEIGQGMGPALNVAAALGAYVLADRSTWLSFRNRSGLRILVEGDARLRNPYGVILVNPARHPHVRAAEGQAFIDWLVSPEGQAAIGAYTVEGQRLFFPDAQGPPRAAAPSATMWLAGAQ